MRGAAQFSALFSACTGNQTGVRRGGQEERSPQFGLDFLSFFVRTEHILHGCRAVSTLFLPELNGLPNPRFIGVTYECWDSEVV